MTTNVYNDRTRNPGGHGRDARTPHRTPGKRGRALRVIATGAVAAFSLFTAACASDADSTDSGQRVVSTDASMTAPDCSDFEVYGSFDDRPHVEIHGAITGDEAELLQDSLKQFEECTGITVTYVGSNEFATGIIVRAQTEAAPDLAVFPQPALFADMARAGYLVPAPGPVGDNVHAFWNEFWQNSAVVDGVLYGAPLTASVKGYVWYSPAEFESKNYEIPTTLEQLNALTEAIAKEGDHKPWCDGFASGDASGWPGTDWVEDMVLRQAGPQTYDRWVSHQIPFNDPAIERAMDSVGALLKNPAHVNNGDGDVSSIATTEFEDAGMPILDGTCSLYHQASFYEGFWKKSDGSPVTVAEDGDVWAFLLPGVEPGNTSAIVGGDLVGAFNDNDATKAVQRYLSSDLWANVRVSLGGVISANTGVNPDNASSALLADGIKTLQHPTTTIRFDASDIMPPVVGAGTFWSGMIDWINGEGTTSVLDAIEISWPQTAG